VRWVPIYCSYFALKCNRRRGDPSFHKFQVLTLKDVRTFAPRHRSRGNMSLRCEYGEPECQGHFMVSSGIRQPFRDST